MERINTDARYFKKLYDEVSEPPEPGVKWVLNDGKSMGTVEAVEPLYLTVDNDINDEYYMYDFYKITFGDIELGVEIDDEEDEPETEIIVYTVAPEYRFDDYIKTIATKVYNKYPKFQEKFEDKDVFFDALRAAGDSNSDKLIKLAEEIGKDELVNIVLDYDFSLYDYSLEWAIKEILK